MPREPQSSRQQAAVFGVGGAVIAALTSVFAFNKISPWPDKDAVAKEQTQQWEAIGKKADASEVAQNNTAVIEAIKSLKEQQAADSKQEREDQKEAAKATTEKLDSLSKAVTELQVYQKVQSDAVNAQRPSSPRGNRGE